MRGGGHRLWGTAVGGSLVVLSFSLQAYPPSHVRQDGADDNDNKQDGQQDDQLAPPSSALRRAVWVG